MHYQSGIPGIRADRRMSFKKCRHMAGCRTGGAYKTEWCIACMGTARSVHIKVDVAKLPKPYLPPTKEYRTPVEVYKETGFFLSCDEAQKRMESIRRGGENGRRSRWG